jgi:hypothetical protein
MSWGLPKGRVFVACVLAALAAGCASVNRQPVPESFVAEATVLGRDHARFWGDEAPKDVVAFVKTHMPNVVGSAASP